MPMRRAIAAMCGATCNVDDAARCAIFLPMQHRTAAQIRTGRQIDLHRAVPACQPCVIWLCNRVFFKDACIVHKDVNMAIQTLKRFCPKPRGNRSVIQVAVLAGQCDYFGCGGSKLAAIAAPMPRDAPVIRICVFIAIAFHSKDKISTKLIRIGGRGCARHVAVLDQYST